MVRNFESFDTTQLEKLCYGIAGMVSAVHRQIFHCNAMLAAVMAIAMSKRSVCCRPVR